MIKTNLVVLISVLTQLFASTSKAPSISAILQKVTNPSKCSHEFAEYITNAIDQYSKPGNMIEFGTILNDLGLVGSESPDDCLPIKNHVGDFISISKEDVLMIEQKILDAVKNAVIVGQKRDHLSRLASEILKTLDPGQLRIARVISEVTDRDDSLGSNICSQDKPDLVMETAPEGQKGLEENFFPALYRFLRRADRCSSGKETITIERINPDEFAERCQALNGNYPVAEVYKCATLTTPGVEDSVVVEPSPPATGAILKDAKRTPALEITTQSFISSSIANQEKIFFTNFHDAAQQLSLLGIKAVGLATQIQAIRGHIMMLQLIDSHIAQLDADHERYTKLLTQAHDRLVAVTGR